MSIPVQSIVDALVSHAQLTGDFEKVNGAEPKSPPHGDLTCAVWAQSIGPMTEGSGLDATTAYVVMNMRIYTNMLQEPTDMIDPKVMRATDNLMASLTSEFTLAGLIRNIDLFGAGSESLRAEAGYVQIGGQGGGLQRIMTITVPMIVNDAWTQEA